MSATQVSAGLGLLRKALPDLSSIEVDVEAKTQFVILSKPMTEEEWLAEYGVEGDTVQ
ncbi:MULTISPECIES: hypothetical protein [unclassified Rhizobium]|uniref:hypothetical protein n=1 Tax=unclassified Rhizobium TaxID=2613769 RepID=UPI00129B3A6D|nr:MULTISPECIES: hypothetical protein [unclassified Rhizobium]